MAEATCARCGDPAPLKKNGEPRQTCRECKPSGPSGGPRPESRLAPLRHKTCQQCGAQFSTRISRQTNCSKRCAKKGERERARARGYVIPKAAICCDECGTIFQGEKPTPGRQSWKRYCSDECLRWARLTSRSVAVPWASCISCRRQFISRKVKSVCPHCSPPKEQTNRRWIAGPCLECGENFVGRWHSQWPCRYCSQTCINRNARAIRRVRKRQGNYEEVWRSKVYERDEWTCRICDEPIDRDAKVPDPLAPTLDHIVPLALGGDHSYANIQCAHFICNARKGDRIEGQIRLAA